MHLIRGKFAQHHVLLVDDSVACLQVRVYTERAGCVWIEDCISGHVSNPVTLAWMSSAIQRATSTPMPGQPAL
jgi:hypothetical protein